MAHFVVTEGRPGQGKSYYLADKGLFLLKRNRKWHEEKGLPLRQVVSNIKFNPEIEKEFEKYIVYWSDVLFLCRVRNADILWDEIAVELDSRSWAMLSREVKRMLSQYRKRGLDIYANTQDIGMLELNARRVMSGAFTATKIMGSPDPSWTKPKVENVWGLIILREIENFKETDPEKKRYTFLPDFMWIKKEVTDLYDTTQDIGHGELPRLSHMIQYCEHYGSEDVNHVCDYKKIIHS